jgi:hypothetical protein
MIFLTPAPTVQARPVASSIFQPSLLLVQAMREISNLEMDWLWLATQLTAAHEQRYCLEYALYIHPQSEIVRAKLARLKHNNSINPWRWLGLFVEALRLGIRATTLSYRKQDH